MKKFTCLGCNTKIKLGKAGLWICDCGKRWLLHPVYGLVFDNHGTYSFPNKGKDYK